MSATASTDVELDGDNSRFVGQFNIDTGSALSVNEQKNLGDASVINNGLLIISTERSWAMTHSISGSGDVTKLGTGILTLNNDSAAYQGTTDIVGGEITAYKADIPLGMIREENDFRISVAGAQEKTALLRIGNDWCIPKGITPTTHIIKLPIGEIRQPNATLDLSQSVDNEYYCLLLAKELGLNVPDAEIIKAGNVRALAVERFDRRWNTTRFSLGFCWCA